ncbi:MAG: hypothetical protein AAB284_09570, partial [Chloroflexota bacterium]
MVRERVGALALRARKRWTWLRERGLVTIGTALLLQALAAAGAPTGRLRFRPLIRALALALLLVVALVALAAAALFESAAASISSWLWPAID